eukprot:m51a1_g10300 hypothetical protein (547) ;mRNA; r:57434-59358
MQPLVQLHLLPLTLLLLPAAALCSAVLAQYNKTARVHSSGPASPVYATPRVYSDAQFLFRELPGLDGSADGVSLMPAATDGFFLCAEGSGTDRLVVVSGDLSPALCTFRKVAGLSNPALVSFEQRGRYVAYARGYSYDCASAFERRTGWTVGLVERPADTRLATWVASLSSPLSLYVQDTNYWLCELSGSAVFADTSHPRDSVRCQWEAVAALGTADSPSSAVSLRLRNTSLFLGVAEHESPDDNDSAALQLRVHSCAGTERLCVWTAAKSEQSGDFFLTHVASGLVVTLHDSAEGKRAVLLARQRNATLQTLGFWRSAYAQPKTPDVVVAPVVQSGSTAADGSESCAQRKTCQSCASGGELCGCLSLIALAAAVVTGLPSLVVRVVGVVGCVAVVVCAAATVAIVARALARRSQGISGAPTQEPSTSADFVFVSRDNETGAPTEFLAVTPDIETGVPPDTKLSGLSTDAGQFAAGESLAPLSLASGISLAPVSDLGIHFSIASGPCLPMTNLGIHFGITSDVLSVQADTGTRGPSPTSQQHHSER